MTLLSPRAARLTVLILAAAGFASGALQLDQYTRTVHEFKLANGLKVVLIEDHGAPVVTACFTAQGGYADDPPGMRGMANMAPPLLENGPEQLGSKNLTEERAAIQTMNAAYAEWKALELKPGASALYDRMRAESKLKLAIRSAESYGKPLFTSRAMDYYGADPFRTAATADLIQWFARMPSNRVDAFLLVYGEWLRQPFPRLVYFNKDRRNQQYEQAQNSPDAALRRTLLPLAFGSSAYGLPEWDASGMERLQYSAVEGYLKSRLAASNLMLTLAGDMTLETARALAEKYLSRIPAGAPVVLESPKLGESKEVRAAPPKEAPNAIVVGYRRPLAADPDDPIMDVIVELMLEGPNGRFRTEFLAAYPMLPGMVPIPSLPGSRHGGLLAVIVPHHPAKNPKEWANLIAEFFEEMGKTPVPVETIARAQRSIEGRLLNVLGDPSQAALHIGRVGGWTQVVEMANSWARVTPADVQRVAAKYFQPELRVILQPGYNPAEAVAK